jgi:RNA polymerase sigma factor (sigma-70 family)
MHKTPDFVNLILSHQGLIYKITRVYVDDAEDQKDLYQEIVFQLFKSIKNFKGNAKISTWMYRLAMNTAIAYLNKSKRQKHSITSFELPDIPDDTSAVMEERSNHLYTAIKKLTVIERGIIVLFLEGKNYREIGEITGFSESNVGTRMGRIKQKLKELIKE